MMMLRPFLTIIHLSAALAFSSGPIENTPFSLSSYQKARAAETSYSLDASRFHFQILFVDSDNFHGRIAEGMLLRLAEYNDALSILFPNSATIESSPKAPIDAAASDEAVAVCESLGLCATSCSDDGTAFDLAFFSEYDLIITLDDEIQSLILRSLPPDSGYDKQCRVLSEFLSIDFCGIVSQGNLTEDLLQGMIDPELLERAKPFYDLAKGCDSNIFSDSASTWNNIHQPRLTLSESGAAVLNTNGWPMVEAAMLVACAGVTRFCLDTMDSQFDAAFQTLLGQHFYNSAQLDCSIDQADAQLRKSSASVTGYFSPKQRCTRIERHMQALRLKLD